MQWAITTIRPQRTQQTATKNMNSISSQQCSCQLIGRSNVPATRNIIIINCLRRLQMATNDILLFLSSFVSLCVQRAVVLQFHSLSCAKDIQVTNFVVSRCHRAIWLNGS